MSPAAAAPRTAVPKAPSVSPLTSRESAQFQALKRSLAEIVSWELTDSHLLRMAFTEAGSEAQAQAFIASLQKG